MGTLNFTAGKARRCTGGALTEFVIVMTAFIPLIFGLPMIGKMIDLGQTAVQGSRYAAWESTVRSDGIAPDDLRSRFFNEVGTLQSDANGNAGSPQASESPDSADAAPASGSPFARVSIDASSVSANGNAGSPQASESPDSADAAPASGSPFARVSIDASSVSAIPYYSARLNRGDGEVPVTGTNLAREMGAAVSNVAETMADLTGGDWGFESDGLLRSGVRFDVEANGLIGRSTFEETAVIMNDAWGVHDDAAAAKRAKVFVPAGALDKLGVDNIIAAVGYIPVYKELRSIDGAFGHVDMSPLPASEEASRVRRPETESP